MIDTQTRRHTARRIMLQAKVRNWMTWYEPRSQALLDEVPLHEWDTDSPEVQALVAALPGDAQLSSLERLAYVECASVAPLGHEDARYLAQVRGWLIDALVAAYDARFTDAWHLCVEGRRRLAWLLFERKRAANTQAHRHLNEGARAALVHILNELTILCDVLYAAHQALS